MRDKDQRHLYFGLVLAGIASLATAAFSVPETITIQGTLQTPGGEAYSGTYLCQVRFIDQAAGGQELGSVTQTIQISEAGRFSIQFTPPLALLDAVDPRYELAVDVDGDGFDPGDIFPNLVTIQSVPFALRAGDAESLGGLPAGTYVQNSSVSAQAWGLTGNDAAPGQFLGTTNDQSLELRVNGHRALQLIPNATSPVVIGGHSSNSMDNGAAGATIAGGGWTGLDRNWVGGDWSTIGGGKRNLAQGLSSTVAGGDGNRADERYATIAGGADNIAEGVYSTIGGGDRNGALSSYTTVGGGIHNSAISPFCTIAGGSGNRAEDFAATVGGGAGNAALGEDSTIAGGFLNSAAGLFAMVAGGTNNHATGDYSFAAGRRSNALHRGSFVWADSADVDVSSTTDDQFLVRAAGGINLTLNEDPDGLRILNPGIVIPNVVGGDTVNVIGGDGSNTVGDGIFGATIGGGGTYSFYSANRVEGNFGTVGGGVSNSVYGFGAVVGAGVNNSAQGDYSTAPGGFENSANGDFSFAAGYRATAAGRGSFVWSDGSSNSHFGTSEENQFAVRAENGLRLSEDAPPDKEVGFGEYYRDNSILAWAKVSASGIVNASHGLESVAHLGDGVYTLTVTDAAADANSLVPIANAEIDTAPAAAADLRIVSINQKNVFPYKSFNVYINRGTGALVDNDFVFILTGR